MFQEDLAPIEFLLLKKFANNLQSQPFLGRHFTFFFTIPFLRVTHFLTA